jgi:hypothetical protein
MSIDIHQIGSVATRNPAPPPIPQAVPGRSGASRAGRLGVTERTRLRGRGASLEVVALWVALVRA